MRDCSMYVATAVGVDTLCCVLEEVRVVCRCGLPMIASRKPGMI